MIPTSPWIRNQKQGPPRFERWAESGELIAWFGIGPGSCWVARILGEMPNYGTWPSMQSLKEVANYIDGILLSAGYDTGYKLSTRFPDEWNWVRPGARTRP